MIICSCKGISDRTIHRLIRDGNITVEALAAATDAGTDCGMCVNALHAEIDQLVARAPEILASAKLALVPTLTSDVSDRRY